MGLTKQSKRPNRLEQGRNIFHLGRPPESKPYIAVVAELKYRVSTSAATALLLYAGRQPVVICGSMMQRLLIVPKFIGRFICFFLSQLEFCCLIQPAHRFQTQNKEGS